MNDQRKTKKQLLDELERERERSELAEDRSLALQDVSKRVASAHDTDEVLDLIVNECQGRREIVPVGRSETVPLGAVV